MRNRLPLLIAIAAMMLAGCLDALIDTGSNGDPEPTPSPLGDAHSDAALAGVAVLGSDYVATTLSLLDAGGRISADTILHSGSVDPALSTALSGDVVLGHNTSPTTTVALLDRTNAVLTWFDPIAGVVHGQAMLGAPGFNGVNPYDYLDLGDGRAYVARWGYVRNDLGDVVEGDDLAIVDIAGARVTGRVALTNQAAAVATTDGTPTYARPARVLRVGDAVYVLLQSLTPTYVNGSAVVAVVDPASDTVAAQLVIPEKSNCGDMTYATATSSVVVVCSGGFADADQLANSGIVVIDASVPLAPATARIIDAAAFAAQPLGAVVARLDDTHVAVVEQGAIDFATFAVLADDVVHAVDVTATTVTAVEVSRVHDAFVTTLFGDPRTGRLFVGEATFAAPRVLVFRDRDRDGAWEMVGRRAFTDALPPRVVVGY